MKKTNFEEVSEDTLENVTGGRRKKDSWKRNAIEFLKGFLNAWNVSESNSINSQSFDHRG